MPRENCVSPITVFSHAIKRRVSLLLFVCALLRYVTLPFAIQVEILVVAIQPGVSGVRLAGGLALHDATFAFDERRVGGLPDEFRWDKNFDADPPVFQLAGRLDTSTTREIRVILQAHLTNEHAVVLDHVLIICKETT